MVEDKDITLSGKSAVMRYLFEVGLSTSVNSKSLPDYLIEATQNNMPSKYKRAYRYADKGSYIYGLPKAESSRDAVDVTSKIKEIIELDLGTSINLLYGKLEEANYYHFMWKILIDDYGYNPTTNELENLTALKGFTCYLTSAQIHYCNDTMQAVIDTATIPVVLCTNSAGDVSPAQLAPYGVCRVLDKAVMEPVDVVAAVRRFA
jgi:hypothetical protein